MNKSDLTDQFASKAGIPKVRAHSYLNILFQLIGDALKEGEKVVISDFGTFTVSRRKGFTGKNPRTGAVIEVPPRHIPIFRCGKALKKALNGD